MEMNEWQKLPIQEKIDNLERYLCDGIKEPKDVAIQVLEYYIELKKQATITQKT